MSNNQSYIQQELNKIYQDKSYPYPLNAAMVASWIAIHHKGVQVKILNLDGVSSLCDYFVLASVQNPMQALAIVDEVDNQLHRLGLRIRGKEGNRESNWQLLDAGDIIVHIFDESARETYNLDKLWKDAPIVAIPESYYFDAQSMDSAASASSVKEMEEGYI